MDFSVSALATDNRSLTYHLFQILTPTFSSQQSELATMVVLVPTPCTQHSPPLGATANVELLFYTNLTFSFFNPLMSEK